MKLIDFVNLPEINNISPEQVTSLNKDIASKAIEEINEIVPNHKKQMLDEYLISFLNVTQDPCLNSDPSMRCKLSNILDSLRETSE